MRSAGQQEEEAECAATPPQPQSQHLKQSLYASSLHSIHKLGDRLLVTALGNQNGTRAQRDLAKQCSMVGSLETGIRYCHHQDPSITSTAVSR